MLYSTIESSINDSTSPKGRPVVPSSRRPVVLAYCLPGRGHVKLAIRTENQIAVPSFGTPLDEHILEVMPYQVLCRM